MSHISFYRKQQDAAERGKQDAFKYERSCERSVAVDHHRSQKVNVIEELVKIDIAKVAMNPTRGGQ